MSVNWEELGMMKSVQGFNVVILNFKFCVIMLSSEWWIVSEGYVVWCYVITRLCSTSFATCLTLGSRPLYQRKANRMSSCLLVCRVSLLFTLHPSQASSTLSSCRFSFVLWNLESGENAMAWQRVWVGWQSGVVNLSSRFWKNYYLYKIRIQLPKEGVEACSGLCGYISSWCLWSAQAECY